MSQTNMDFSQRVVVDTNQAEWQPSPMAGVWRKPLAREDAERGHAGTYFRNPVGFSHAPFNEPGASCS